MTENDGRAARAQDLVNRYITEYGDAGDEETVTDILTDMLHAYGRTIFDKAARMARIHHEAEVRGDDIDRAAREALLWVDLPSHPREQFAVSGRALLQRAVLHTGETGEEIEVTCIPEGAEGVQFCEEINAALGTTFEPKHFPGR